MQRIAVIGAGFMGQTHADAYKNIDNAQLVAVCEQNEELGKTYAEKYDCRHFTDLDELQANVEIDAIDICLPTFLHEAFTVKAAAAGKNIITEKPVTLNVDSLDRMLEAVEENKAAMFVGQVVRFWPEYVKARELIQAGDLGEIKSYYAARLSQHPAWSEWYRKEENSGGGLLDLHLHDIDYTCHLFGKAKKVFAIGRKNSYGCWNHVTSTLIFENGMKATVEGILEMAPGYPFTTELRIVGSDKVYEAQMKAGKNVENIAASTRGAFLYGDGEAKKLEIEEYDAYEAELRHFVQCLEDHTESPYINMKQVRNVLCTIRALKQSLEEEREVEVSYQ